MRVRSLAAAAFAFLTLTTSCAPPPPPCAPPPAFAIAPGCSLVGRLTRRAGGGAAVPARSLQKGYPFARRASTTAARTRLASSGIVCAATFPKGAGDEGARQEALPRYGQFRDEHERLLGMGGGLLDLRDGSAPMPR